MISRKNLYSKLYLNNCIDILKRASSDKLDLRLLKKVLLDLTESYELDNKGSTIVNTNGTISREFIFEHEVRYDYISGDRRNIVVKRKYDDKIKIKSIDFTLSKGYMYVSLRPRLVYDRIAYYFRQKDMKEVGDYIFLNDKVNGTIFEEDGVVKTVEVTSVFNADYLDLKGYDRVYGCIGFNIKSKKPITYYYRREE